MRAPTLAQRARQIIRDEGPATTAELAEALGTSRAAVTQAIQRRGPGYLVCTRMRAPSTTSPGRNYHHYLWSMPPGS